VNSEHVLTRDRAPSATPAYWRTGDHPYTGPASVPDSTYTFTCAGQTLVVRASNLTLARWAARCAAKAAGLVGSVREA
jgi:hypothetical protein